MADKILFETPEEYETFREAHKYGKGILSFPEEGEPESYPCILVHGEYDISNSMSYGCGWNYEFVYLSDFEDYLVLEDDSLEPPGDYPGE